MATWFINVFISAYHAYRLHSTCGRVGNVLPNSVSVASDDVIHLAYCIIINEAFDAFISTVQYHIIILEFEE